jgi:hypothetical protein
LVREIGAGVATSATDQPDLQDVLRGLLHNSAERERCGKAGRAWALQWLSADTGRNRFRAALQQARQFNSKLAA